MLVSGLVTTVPVFKDSYSIGWNKIDAGLTGDCRSSYAVCNSCAVVAWSSLKNLMRDFAYGLELVEVEAFPEDLMPYKTTSSVVECIEFGDTKLVIRLRQ